MAAAADLARANALGRLVLLTGAEAYLAAAVTPPPAPAAEALAAPAPEETAEEAAVRRDAETMLAVGPHVVGIFHEAIDRNGGQIPKKYLPKTDLTKLARAGLLDSPEGRRVSERGRSALPVASTLMPRP